MNRYYSAIAQSRISIGTFSVRGRIRPRRIQGSEAPREVFVKDLLTPFLSPNLGTCTGIIVDSHGGSSGQIDIIIYDKTLIPSLLHTNEEGIVPVESVLATIEVKSELTRGELRKAVENARSIKTLRPEYAEVMPETNVKNRAVCCLFAFKSDSKPESELNRLQSGRSRCQSRPAPDGPCSP